MFITLNIFQSKAIDYNKICSGRFNLLFRDFQKRMNQKLNISKFTIT